MPKRKLRERVVLLEGCKRFGLIRGCSSTHIIFPLDRVGGYASLRRHNEALRNPNLQRRNLES
jgi:hypothetical protein